MKYWVPRQKPKWLLIDCLILHANLLVFLFENKQEILIRSRVSYSCTVLFHSLCHYWDRLFTSEIICCFRKHLNSLLLMGRKNQKQANQSFLGWFFFSKWVGAQQVFWSFDELCSHQRNLPVIISSSATCSGFLTMLYM